MQSGSARQRRRRRGTALIEFAVCLPVFAMIALATIETCRMIYLRQSAKIAAYETARLGIVPQASQQNMTDLCDLILQGRNITNYTLATDPIDPTTTQYGDLLEVSVTVPANENSLVGTWFYQDKTFTETVRIMAEY